MSDQWEDVPGPESEGGWEDVDNVPQIIGPDAVATGEAIGGASALGKGAWDINKYRANNWKPVVDESPYGVQKYLNKQLRATGIPRGTVSLEDLGKATNLDVRSTSEVQDALRAIKAVPGTQEPIIEIIQGEPTITGYKNIGGKSAIDLKPYVKLSELEKRAPKAAEFLEKYDKPITAVAKRTVMPGALGLSAAEAQAAINRAREDNKGMAALDIAGAIGAPVAAAKFLPKKLRILGGLAAATAPAAEAVRGEIQGHAAGGAIQNFAGGGLGLAEKVAKAAHEYASQKPGRMTDFLQHHIDKFVVPTQADRMGGIGGPSFSANSLALPQYKGIAWGSGNQPAATGLTNLAKDERFGGPENQIFVPLLGHENQHKSNQIVFNRLMEEFYKNPEALTPELRDRINSFMQSGGGLNKKTGEPNFAKFSGFDITNKDDLALLGQSFENRGLIAQHAFGGKGLEGKKGQIIPYQQILDEMADPTVKGAPTFAVGPRAFSLAGEVHPDPRPDLNAAFPYVAHGEDYGVTFNPVPNRFMFPDFQNEWRAAKGKSNELLKSGLPPEPGYYENTMGYKVKPEDTERVYPRQEVTEKLLDDLYEAGHKKGGLVHLAGGGEILKKLLPLAEREGNLAKFLEPSVVKNKLYHATNADIKVFDPSMDVRGNNLMFVSEDPDVAHGIYSMSKGMEGSNIMPVHIQTKNPFDPMKNGISPKLKNWINKNKDKIEEDLNYYKDTLSLSGNADNYLPEGYLDVENFIKNLEGGDWQAVEASPTLIQGIKNEGHDSIKTYEEGAHTHAVFEPTQIKSAIGNEGTFDPTNPDITKKRGGLV